MHNEGCLCVSVPLWFKSFSTTEAQSTQRKAEMNDNTHEKITDLRTRLRSVRSYL